MTALPRRVRVGYALGGISSGTYGTVPGLILMPFLTDLLGVQAAIAGMIVFAPKAWDFFLNPIAGRISDRSRNAQDRRRPFILRAEFRVCHDGDHGRRRPSRRLRQLPDRLLRRGPVRLRHVGGQHGDWRGGRERVARRQSAGDEAESGDVKEVL